MIEQGNMDGVGIDERVDFERFVADHGDRLLHAAYGLCGDWQHAEDLTQQVLIKVADRWAQIENNPLGYAYRCLQHASIDRWRWLRHRRPEFVSDPAALVNLRPGEQPDAAPTSQVDDALAVSAALQRLAPRQRAILVLRYLQDLPEAEVAAVLHISIGSVKSGAARALARLRAMEPSPFEEGDR